MPGTEIVANLTPRLRAIIALATVPFTKSAVRTISHKGPATCDIVRLTAQVARGSVARSMGRRAIEVRLFGQFLCAATTAISVVVSAPFARASDNTSNAAEVRPPRLLSDLTADYPAHGEGDAVVLVHVTVNANGQVSDVVVVTGDEPFATAAQRAAFKFAFSPAERNGRAVRVKVALEIRFQAAQAQEVVDNIPTANNRAAPRTEGARAVDTTQNSTNALGKASVSDKQNHAIEVVVHGDRSAPGVSASMPRAEIRQLPGAFGDPFRAIEALPGVTPIASGVPFFYVRGAPPGNVGYFFDGVRVPYLFHLAIGPSIIHPGMVERVDLYPGGYPAQFGRFAGGIVSAEATKPNPTTHGEGNIRLFDAGALAETGFADAKGSVLLGGRYSYTAALLSQIAPGVHLGYRDFQARVTYAPNAKDKLSLFTFGAYDLLGFERQGVYRIIFGTEFYRSNLGIRHEFDRDTTLQTDVTLGFDQTHLGTQRNGRNRSLNPRVTLTRHLRESLSARMGIDMLVEGVDADGQPRVDHDDPQVQLYERLFRYRTDLAFGAWSDLVWRVSPRVEVIPGVRAEAFRSGSTTVVALDPRLAARFRISDRVRIVHAYGIAHQPPTLLVPLPGLSIANLENGLQSSIQTSAGVEVDVLDSTTASAQLFHNAFFRMTDVLGTIGRFDERADGSASGLELLVRRRFSERISGFASYTLSRSIRHMDGESVPSAMDRTHVGNLALSVDVGRRWRAGARVVAYSGLPKLRLPDGSDQRLEDTKRTERIGRDSGFYRLDLRLEKRWPFVRAGYWSFVAEVMNATQQKETLLGETVGPILIPSVGLEASF